MTAIRKKIINSKTTIAEETSNIMISNKKERCSNLELFRILVMLSIVAHHYVVNSGVLEIAKEDPISLRSIYYYVFGAWGKVGINCFVLITGYFMCKSEITLQKFLKLFLEVLFYIIMVNSVLVITGKEEVTISVIWSNMQVMTDVSTCFTSCFMLFYLFIPFLNILVRNMTQRQHLSLVILCLFVYTGISTFLLGRVVMNYVVWFCILYFISSYIRLYQPFQNVRWGGVLGGVSLLSVGSIIGILFVGNVMGIQLPLSQYHFISDSNKLLAVALSVSMFMFFKDLQIPRSKVINRIAQSCFGVLLIHANSDAMRHWLWKDTLDVAGQYNTDLFILHSILSVIGIYIVCTIIDQLRIILLEEPLFNWLYNKREFKDGGTKFKRQNC